MMRKSTVGSDASVQQHTALESKLKRSRLPGVRIGKLALISVNGVAVRFHQADQVLTE